jgi:hypothetical protein
VDVDTRRGSRLAILAVFGLAIAAYFVLDRHYSA